MPKERMYTGNAIGAYGSSNITFTNCTFKHLRGNGLGGALNIYENSSAYFKDNLFFNNSA